MSGSTAGTIKQISDLLAEWADGQPPQSGHDVLLRDVVVSIQAIAGVTSVAGRTGKVTLTHADFTDWARATESFSLGVVVGTADPTSTTGQGTSDTGSLYWNKASYTLWMNKGTMSALNWQLIMQGALGAPTPSPVPAPTPPTPTPPSPTPSPVPSPVPAPTPPAGFSSGNGPGITNLKAGTSTTSSVTVSWTAPAGTGVGQYYVCQYKRWCDFTWTYTGPPFTATSITIPNLPSNTIYHVRVQPDDGRFSLPVFATTAAAAGQTDSPDGWIVDYYDTANPATNSIKGTDGTIWSLTRGNDATPYYVNVNGVEDTTTAYVANLFYSGGKIYQRITDGACYYKTKPTDAWTSANDPRVGCPPGIYPPASFTKAASADNVMSWHGNDVSNGLQITLIYYGPNWNNGGQSVQQAALTSALKTVLGGPYFQSLSEYFIFTAPTIVKEVVVSTAPPASQTAPDAFNLVTSLFANGTLAPPNVDNHLFFVLYQDGTTITDGSLGIHLQNSYQDNLITFGYCVAYTPPSPRTALDGRTIVCVHEFAETATDPQQAVGQIRGGWSGWVGPTGSPSNADAEIEDFNTATLGLASVGGVYVQGFYSNYEGAYIIPTVGPASLPSWPPPPPAIPSSAPTPPSPVPSPVPPTPTPPSPTPSPVPAPVPPPTPPSPTPTQTPVYAGNPLLFADEFNDLSLWHATQNPNGRWYPGGAQMGAQDNGSQINNTWQVNPYSSQTPFTTYSVANSILSIQIINTPSQYAAACNNLPQCSGAMNTSPHFRFTHGYMEWRMRMPNVMGVGGAVWLWNDTGDPVAQIDMEWGTMGNPPNFGPLNYHMAALVGSSPGTNWNDTYGPSGWDGTQWHIFGIDWQANNIAFYVDGNLIASGAPPSQLSQEMYPVIEQESGTANAWGTGPVSDPSKLPAQCDIDYVRVYTTYPGAPTYQPPSPTPSPVPVPVPSPSPTPPSPTPSPVPSPTPAVLTQYQMAFANSTAAGSSTTAQFASAPDPSHTILVLCVSEDNSVLGLGAPWTAIVNATTADGIRLSAFYGSPSALSNHGLSVVMAQGGLYLIETNATTFDGTQSADTAPGNLQTYSEAVPAQNKSPAQRYAAFWGFASNDGGATGASGAPYTITSGGTLLKAQDGKTGDGFSLLISVPDGSTANIAGAISNATGVTYIGKLFVNGYNPGTSPTPSPVPSPSPTPPSPVPSPVPTPTPSGGVPSGTVTVDTTQSITASIAGAWLPGKTWTDYVSGYVGTAYTGAPGTGTDVYGPCYVGSTATSADGIKISAGKVLAGQASFTILAGGTWAPATVYNGLYCERASTGQDIVKLEAGNEAGGVNSTGIVYRDDAGNLMNGIADGPVVRDNTFHHIAYVKNGNTFTKYVDGVLDNTATLATNNVMTEANVFAMIGADPADATSVINAGKLTYLYTWKRALTQAEIASIKSSPFQFFKAAAPTPTPAPTPPTPTPPTPTPSGANTLTYVGVNLSGLEGNGGVVPGTGGQDYPITGGTDVTNFTSQGCNVVRLCFLMQRAMHSPPSQGGTLDPTYCGYLDTVVGVAAQNNCYVILDAHDYGATWGGKAIGVSGGVSNADFASCWGSIAARYKNNSNVIFGLQNEPGASGQSPASWIASENAAIASIRQAGATSQLILVQGAIGDGCYGWLHTGNDTTFVKSAIVDPNNNYAVEVHQYFDADGSGTNPVPAGNGYVPPEILSPFTMWLRAQGLQGWLGEFGSDTGTDGVAAMTNCVQFLQNNSDVWKGCTGWSGGPDFGPSYVENLNPSNNVYPANFNALRAFASGGSKRGTPLGTQKYPITYSGASFAAGKFGNGLSAGYAAVNSNDCGNLNQSPSAPVATLEAWVTGAASTGSQQIIAVMVNFVHIGVDTGGTAYAKFGNSDGGTISSSTAITGAGPFHVRLVCGASGSALYVNGVSVGTSTSTLASVGFSAGQQLGMRASPAGAAGLSSGVVDEVALWGIATNSGNFTPPTAAYHGYEPGLFAVWHLDNSGDTWGYG